MNPKVRYCLKKIYLFLTRNKLLDVLKIRLMEIISFKIAKKTPMKIRPPLFESILFETRTLCNGKCSFCASSIRYRDKPWARKDTLMPETTFKKVLSQLHKINYKGRIALFINNEPLLDKRLIKFIKLARKACPDSYIQIATNGLLLNNRLGKALMESGLSGLSIDNYSDEFILKDNVKKFLKSVAPKYPKVKIKYFIRRETETLTNRAGSNPVGIPVNKAMKAVCYHPFRQFNITTNGDVSLCCWDLFFKEVMGNVNKEKILDIWNGKKFVKIRTELLKGHRKVSSVCKKCDFCGFKPAHLNKLPFHWRLLGQLSQVR